MSHDSHFATTGIWWQRMYGRVGAAWLITISLGTLHGHGPVNAAYPQAHATVDDFGNLVIVRGWM